MVKRGNYRLAAIYYRPALSLNPSLKEVYNNLGRLYTDFLERPDEGLSDTCLLFRTSTRSSPLQS